MSKTDECYIGTITQRDKWQVKKVEQLNSYTFVRTQPPFIHNSFAHNSYIENFVCTTIISPVISCVFLSFILSSFFASNDSMWPGT